MCYKLSRTLLALLLFSCETDGDFDLTQATGEYTGSIVYFPITNTGKLGDPVMNLSKLDNYHTSIETDGSILTLSFDESFVYVVPDIIAERVTTNMQETWVEIRTTPGQAYDSRPIPSNPTNYIWNNQRNRIVVYQLSVKSNDPDSVYFLHFSLSKRY